MIHSLKNGFIIIKKTFGILDTKERRRLVRVFFLMLISSVLELLGVSVILPFVQAITMPEVLLKNKYVAELCSFLAINDTYDIIVIFGVGIAVIYILKNAYIVYANNVQYDFAAKVQKDISVSILQDYLKRPYEFFLTINSAEVIRSCGSDVNQYYNVLSNVIGIFTECVTVAAISVYLLYQDAIMAISALGVLLIVMIAIIGIFKPISKRTGRVYRIAGALQNKSILQTVYGIKEINVNQRKDLFLKSYEEAAETVRKGFKINSVMSVSTDRIVEGICVAGLMAVVCFRISDMHSATMIIPKLAVFAMAAFKIMPSVGKISSKINGVVFYADSVTNIAQHLEIYGRDRTSIGKVDDSEVTESSVLTFEDKIELNNVCWKYKNSDNNTLSNLDLTINSGDAIAFIGTSGSGKTTLADVILGLLKPQSGDVRCDGYNIYDNKREWAKIVAYVPQSVFLMDDTIRANILFGIPEDTTSDEKVWKALEVAQIRDFVEKLPEGLDTVVGERGIRFSGGQKQRIAIARAVFCEPKLLVLDEATAALDSETESAVMEAIEMLHGKITLVIVAHRLGTVKSCDVIYEIKNGKAIRKSYEEIFGKNN